MAKGLGGGTMVKKNFIVFFGSVWPNSQKKAIIFFFKFGPWDHISDPPQGPKLKIFKK